MTSENFYDRITEQYYEFIASLKNMTVREVIQKAEQISATKQIYKYIISSKPFGDDDIAFLSRLDRPLETIVNIYADIYCINPSDFDRLMFEGKCLGLFEE